MEATVRACIECEAVYIGAIECPQCDAVGEPLDVPVVVLHEDINGHTVEVVEAPRSVFNGSLFAPHVQSKDKITWH